MKRLKKITKASVPRALKKVERYRLLNEPNEAESICRDILDIDPKNNEAQVMLILSLSDQLSEKMTAYDEALELANNLKQPYERHYYQGLLCERRARAHFDRGAMGAGDLAYRWFQEALEHFDRAAKGRPKGNDDALFRWNAIIRTLEEHPEIQPLPENTAPQLLE